MKKEKEIGIQKSVIKKVAQSGSQEIEKRVIKKRERGITLIALVVTIIIMLILAAVTLNMALGDNGLIQMAKLAANKYEQAAINESLAMHGLANDLNNPWSVAPTTTTTPPPTTTTPSGGEEEAPEGPKTASNLNKNNYGDYVDYGLDLSGDKDTTNDWRIFYVGEDTKDGVSETRIFLIAADYVPNSFQALKDAQSTDHANMRPSTTEGYELCCSEWAKKDSATYHCYDGHNKNLNSTKAQCSFPEIFMPSGNFCKEDDHYYCSDNVGTVNSRCASALQCTGNWRPFIDQSEKANCADYAIGGPTLEMWVASWNEKEGDNLYVNGKQNDSNSYGHGYYISGNGDGTHFSTNLSTSQGSKDTLYFPHQQNDHLDLFKEAEAPNISEELKEDTNCSGYWLSSPADEDEYDTFLMDVYYDGFINMGECINYWSDIQGSLGVRPIVCLNSGVKLTKNGTIEDRVVWNIQI